MPLHAGRYAVVTFVVEFGASGGTSQEALAIQAIWVAVKELELSCHNGYVYVTHIHSD